MKLSEELEKACNESNPSVIRLVGTTMLENPSTDYKYAFHECDAKEKFNCNAGVYNIYDERGACFVTTDEKFVKDLQNQHYLSKDEKIGVALCNGMEIRDEFLNTQWKNAKKQGDLSTQQYKEEQRLKAARIAEMRGTAKTTPSAPVNKTEINQQTLGQVLSSARSL